MDLELKDNVTVVVGAAGGIGRAIASAFAAEGSHLALVDTEPGVNMLVDAMETEHNIGGLAIVADITDYNATQRAAYQVFTRWGRCDHVVNAAAAGSGRFGFPFWNLHPDDWPRVLDVNLMGSVHVAHAFAPHLAERGKGTMLFLSSVAGQIGSQTDPPYSAAKAALINFAQCAAKDLAPHGVRVNVISPGMVQTALNRSVWQSWNAGQPEESQQPYEDWAAEKIERLIPLNCWQTPDDIAAMAVFLASPKAANITGQTLNIDGGWVMHS